MMAELTNNINALSHKRARINVPENALPHTRYKLGNKSIIEKVKRAVDAYDYHRPTKGSHPSSILEMCCLGQTTLRCHCADIHTQYYD
jgi:hypothetical protein